MLDRSQGEHQNSRIMEFKRLYTPEEATRALPLVRQIVEDILDTARRIRELAADDAEHMRLEGELEQHLLEIEEMGCFFKDWNFAVGLVDFPSIVDGETVFLCWRSDENELAWYHGIEEGYRGRKRLKEKSTA